MPAQVREPRISWARHFQESYRNGESNLVPADLNFITISDYRGIFDPFAIARLDPEVIMQIVLIAPLQLHSEVHSIKGIIRIVVAIGKCPRVVDESGEARSEDRPAHLRYLSALSSCGESDLFSRIHQTRPPRRLDSAGGEGLRRASLGRGGGREVLRGRDGRQRYAVGAAQETRPGPDKRSSAMGPDQEEPLRHHPG